MKIKMEKKLDEESETDKTEKMTCNEDTKQPNRVQLSPHSHNVSDPAKKTVVADTDKRFVFPHCILLNG